MRPIPGYHYDPEKKKYFKIQPGHTPQGASKYSKDEIKKRERQFVKEKQKATHHERTRLERVKRAKILGLPIFGSLGVEQEIGRCRIPSGNTLNQRAIACAELMDSRRLVNLGCRGEQYCHQFVRDPRTGIILTALKPTSTSNFSAFRPISPDRPWKYDENIDNGIIELGHFEWINALSIHHTGSVLMASQDLLSGKGIRLNVGRLIEPSEAYGKSSRSAFESLSISFKWRGGWPPATAPCPHQSTSLFAVGCANELVGIRCTASQAALHRFDIFPSYISGLDWLSQNEIIVGLKNSAIALYDIRCGGSFPRFTHSHGVQKLKVVDEFRILVAGIDRTLDMYDLRFTPTTFKIKPNPNKPNHKPTTPYLRFGEHNYSTLNDMDVSSCLGLVACATDLPRVQLFSLHTGKLLDPSTIPPERSRHSVDILSRDYMNPIDCVRFETVTEPYEYGKPSIKNDDRNTTSKVSLLVGSGKIIEEWSV